MYLDHLPVSRFVVVVVVVVTGAQKLKVYRRPLYIHIIYPHERSTTEAAKADDAHFFPSHAQDLETLGRRPMSKSEEFSVAPPSSH